MKFKIFIIIFLIALKATKAGMFPDYVYFYAPGFKVGYDFWNKPGFTIGGDISLCVLGINDGPKWLGCNLSLEKNIKQNMWRFRHDIMCGYAIAGIALGGEYYNNYNFHTRLLFNGYFGCISYAVSTNSQKTYSNLQIGAQLPIIFYCQY